MTGPATEPSPAGHIPDDSARLILVTDAFRVGALAYAAVSLGLDYQKYAHPRLAWLVLGVLAAWTVCLVWLGTGRVRPGPVMMADLALVVAAIIATRWLDDPSRIAAGAQTLPAFYAAAAVISWAVRWEWRGGLVAATAVAAGGLIEVQPPNSQTVSNIVLLLLAGLIVGYATGLLRTGRAQLAAAVAQRAATAERERLARDIHDSVLQVLGFVHRAGAGQPGPAGERARVACELEAGLGALISTGPAPRPLRDPGPDAESDLRAELARYAGTRVLVSAPAGPVLLPSAAVSALAAATGEALANVRKHAGASARAWVLVEDEPRTVTVTVRDDGPGLEPGRLDGARAQGRLGIRMSIVGRIEEAGGQVLITGPPGEGTEVEMRMPRPGDRR